MVVTANRLGDGAVVYRTVNDDWTTDLAAAAVVAAPAAAVLLQRAEADGVRAVGPYIAPVERGGGQPRAAGQSARAHPACRPDLRAAGHPVLEGLKPDVPLRRFDQTLVDQRVSEFRDQVSRRLSGALTEDEFKPLRLMNGVYLQLHAYMLRIAIPYGTLSSEQMRMLAHVARRYDRGYGHFTTRQNLQFNWIKLEEMPDTLADLAKVGMHAMQTCGNCIRNITTDQWAGVAADEIEDPRIWAEVLRQHSTMHPEFTFLPRKFKIAITAAGA